MSGASVPPCRTSVTRTTEKAVKRTRSRPGNAAGRASAAARVTIPRIPLQPIAMAGRREVRQANRESGDSRQPATSAYARAQSMRTTITAAQTAAAVTR